VLSLIGPTVTDWADTDGVAVGGIAVGGTGVGGAGVGRSACSSVTMIVAVMKGWTVQKYGNSPASWNVNAKDSPVFRIPLSQISSLSGDMPDVDV